MGHIEYRKRAWLFAHKLLTLGAWVEESHVKDMLVIPTKEITKAMDQEGPAKLEDVQTFIFHVLEFMRGSDLVTACGCGYLSIRLAPSAVWDNSLNETSDLTEFLVEDVDALFEDVIANTTLGSGPKSGNIEDQGEPL